MFGLIGALSLQQRLVSLAVFVLWSLGCAAGGWTYKWHTDSVRDAAVAATQTTAQTTVDAGAKASDAVTVDTLKSQLTVAQSTTAGLLKYIKDLQNANPASVDCRVPDGLRASINADLAAAAR